MSLSDCCYWDRDCPGPGECGRRRRSSSSAVGSVRTAWTFVLILTSFVSQVELHDNDNDNEDVSEALREAALSNSTAAPESGETIQSLNPWVRIPDDWKNTYGDDTGTTSSESFFQPNSAESRAYSEHQHHESEHEHDHDLDHPDHDHHESVAEARHRGVDPDGNGNKRGRGGASEPYFDHAMMTNLSEQLGNHAFLRCRVKNLGDRVVSWIRRRDWHILTSGRITYTNDDRFQIVHNDGSDEWTLVIKFVQTRDNGTYECQVSSGRGIIAHLFNLNVLVPQAHILGAQEYHVQQGTVISLVCIIENSPRQSPQYLYWYHNNQMVNYGSGVSVHTEPGIRTHSRLTVPSAGHQHAGNYTCKASNTQPATVQVYVSDGDKTAAIQRQSGSHFVPDWWTFLMAELFLVIFTLYPPFNNNR